MRKHKTTIAIVASLTALFVTGLVMAQPQGGQRGQRGQRGTPEEMRKMFEERMAENMKNQLEITDTEWTALKPYFQKVTDLTRQASGGGRGGMMGGRGGMMGGRGGMMGGRGGQDRGGRGGQDRERPERPQPQNDVEKTAEALDELLNSENPSNEQIKAKLAALRGARTKAEQELIKAQGQLRALLTLKQEARLVRMGLLK